MKNLKRLGLGILILSLVLIITNVSNAAGGVFDQDGLNGVYNEELYAQKLYEKMVEKFENDAYYKKLAQAESRHAQSVKNFMLRNGIRPVEKEFTIKVSDDELTALKDALQFEKDDIAFLEKKIAVTSNESEKLLYTRLKDRSDRHRQSLEAAITSYADGKIIGTCPMGGNFQAKGQGLNRQNGSCPLNNSENGNKNFGQGQGQGPGQGQGNGIKKAQNNEVCPFGN
ncbi:MAG: DUF2202 domain-containing protein [Tissierellia bacterium]|nr:DUF2202 domain-containing protein [Tissierellia bacterium]